MFSVFSISRSLNVLIELDKKIIGTKNEWGHPLLDMPTNLHVRLTAHGVSQFNV